MTYVSPPWIYWPACTFFCVNDVWHSSVILSALDTCSAQPLTDAGMSPLGWNEIKKKNNLKAVPWQAYGQEIRQREAWLSSVWDMFLCGWLCLCTRHQEGDQSDRNVRGENEKARRASGILAKLEKCVLFETKHFRGKVRRRQVNRAVIHLLCWQWDVVCQGEIHFVLKNISRLWAAADLCLKQQDMWLLRFLIPVMSLSCSTCVLEPE